MYSSYQIYTTRGGKLPEAEYTPLAIKACEYINEQTLGRAPAYAATLADELAAAECDLVSVLDGFSRADSGLASENIDGYSYTVGAHPAAAKSEAVRSVLVRHLFLPARGINLLYRGIDA